MPRNPRSQRDQQRGAPRFAPKKRLLIVCEGTKTELLYFIDACNELGVHKGLAVVDVVPGDGSNPINVVSTAARLYRAEQKSGNAFDAVYCAMDRDEHMRFDEAMDRAEALRFNAIVSVPSFEYWLLLHFRDTSAPLVREGVRSPGDCCVRALQAEWAGYTKGRRHVFRELSPRLAQARLRATRRLAAAEREGSDNPSTRVHLLVDALEALTMPEQTIQ